MTWVRLIVSLFSIAQPRTLWRVVYSFSSVRHETSESIVTATMNVSPSNNFCLSSATLWSSANGSKTTISLPGNIRLNDKVACLGPNISPCDAAKPRKLQLNKDAMLKCINGGGEWGMCTYPGQHWDSNGEQVNGWEKCSKVLWWLRTKYLILWMRITWIFQLLLYEIFFAPKFRTIIGLHIRVNVIRGDSKMYGRVPTINALGVNLKSTVNSFRFIVSGNFSGRAWYSTALIKSVGVDLRNCVVVEEPTVECETPRQRNHMIRPTRPQTDWKNQSRCWSWAMRNMNSIKKWNPTELVCWKPKESKNEQCSKIWMELHLLCPVWSQSLSNLQYHTSFCDYVIKLLLI